jgi:hypothetical protein
MKERIDNLREWAGTRARPASSGAPEPPPAEDLLQNLKLPVSRVKPFKAKTKKEPSF